MEKKEFGDRLYALRSKTKLSAREMSLALGQNFGYINNIENGKSFPSMELFNRICEFLTVTEEEFYHLEGEDPAKVKHLTRLLEQLDEKDLTHILALAESLAEKQKK